jgi:hypothetical protein
MFHLLNCRLPMIESILNLEYLFKSCSMLSLVSISLVIKFSHLNWVSFLT